jgi:hypothetical protein
MAAKPAPAINAIDVVLKEVMANSARIIALDKRMEAIEAALKAVAAGQTQVENKIILLQNSKSSGGKTGGARKNTKLELVDAAGKFKPSPDWFRIRWMEDTAGTKRKYLNKKNIADLDEFMKRPQHKDLAPEKRSLTEFNHLWKTYVVRQVETSDRALGDRILKGYHADRLKFEQEQAAKSSGKADESTDGGEAATGEDGGEVGEEAPADDAGEAPADDGEVPGDQVDDA